MSIYEYNEESGPGDFIGLRVVVSIDGETLQKWFSFREQGIHLSTENKKRVKVRAQALEASWLHTQKNRAAVRANNAEETRHSLYDTGVRGIKMKFLISKKFRGNEWRKYYTPVFIVSGSNKNKRFSKNFNIMSHGYDKAWAYAIVYYAVKKTLTDPKALMARRPPVEKFAVIYKEYKRCGHKVPKTRIPRELLAVPKFWDYFNSVTG